MSQTQSSHLKFSDSDTPVQKTVIGAFLDIYNAYYRATKIVDLDRMLAEMVLTARALYQIGEVDESVCEAMESMCRELSAQMTHVGRSAATIIQHMHNKRNGEEGMEAVTEQWPDVVNDQEM